MLSADIYITSSPSKEKQPRRVVGINGIAGIALRIQAAQAASIPVVVQGVAQAAAPAAAEATAVLI